MGIDPTVLAEVIQHEGGNVRRFGKLWRAIERQAKGKIGPIKLPDGLGPLPTNITSVGIAQIDPATAVGLAKKFYGVELSQDEARIALIENDQFSIRIAAAKIRSDAAIIQRVNPALATNENLFVSYAAKANTVLRLSESGFDINRAQLPSTTKQVLMRRSTTHFGNARDFVVRAQEFGGLYGGLAPWYPPVFA